MKCDNCGKEDVVPIGWVIAKFTVCPECAKKKNIMNIIKEKNK